MSRFTDETPEQRQARIRALKTQISEGTYRVDAYMLAGQMLHTEAKLAAAQTHVATSAASNDDKSGEGARTEDNSDGNFLSDDESSDRGEQVSQKSLFVDVSAFF